MLNLISVTRGRADLSHELVTFHGFCRRPDLSHTTSESLRALPFSFNIGTIDAKSDFSHPVSHTTSASLRELPFSFNIGTIVTKSDFSHPNIGTIVTRCDFSHPGPRLGKCSPATDYRNSSSSFPRPFF